MNSIIKEFEGLSLKPYLCPAGVATIGYGNTMYEDGRKVTMSDAPITLERASSLFDSIHKDFEREVRKVVKSDLNANQLNALTSFVYNVGIGNFRSSTLLKKVNINPNDLSIKAEFAKWNKGGGKVLNGLVTRRKRESEIYFS